MGEGLGEERQEGQQWPRCKLKKKRCEQGGVCLMFQELLTFQGVAVDFTREEGAQLTQLRRISMETGCWRATGIWLHWESLELLGQQSPFKWVYFLRSEEASKALWIQSRPYRRMLASFGDRHLSAVLFPLAGGGVGKGVGLRLCWDLFFFFWNKVCVCVYCVYLYLFIFIYLYLYQPYLKLMATLVPSECWDNWVRMNQVAWFGPWRLLFPINM